jgi:radical SAM enzyme (TIGR01210 family)
MNEEATFSGAREQILEGAYHASKTFSFAEHDATRVAQWWFQQTTEGLVLFVVFYTLACRWNRCVGCNLPSKGSLRPISYREIIAQVDQLFAEPEIKQRASEIRKVILSNNGSILDQITFPSTALMYLLARINLQVINMSVLSIETRVEYVEWEELEFLARAMRERENPADLELAVGFEAFDDKIRNQQFHKGLSLAAVEQLLAMLSKYGYGLKCYFMLKPVPEMSNDDAVQDIHQAIDWLDKLALQYQVQVNIHLNPTYVAYGTALEEAFNQGRYTPPTLHDVARAAYHARGRHLSIYLGLYDEGLAVPGGSFIREDEAKLVEQLELFNQTQKFNLLNDIVNQS